MGVWLAPGAHVVHYPVAAGAQIAVVAIVPDNRMTDDWAAANDWSALEPHLTAFAPALRTVLATAPEWRRWALFETDPLAHFAEGRIVLAGDAAHPMFPFLAQGGVMALEDALVLAEMLAARRDDPAGALKAYESARQPRVNAVVAMSRQNGRIFHLAGPAALARNLAMATLPAARLMARYDWVYGWRPPA
jgi:salicylate hydroxylase